MNHGVGKSGLFWMGPTIIRFLPRANFFLASTIVQKLCESSITMKRRTLFWVRNSLTPPPSLHVELLNSLDYFTFYFTTSFLLVLLYQSMGPWWKILLEKSAKSFLLTLTLNPLPPLHHRSQEFGKTFICSNPTTIITN